MCQTCNNTGGIAIDNGWFIEYHPCPSTNCDYDGQAEFERNIAILEEKLKRSERETA